MAVTQYQIFCRYFNGDINKSVTNQTPIDWISKTEYNSLRKFCTDPENIQLYKQLCTSLRGRNAAENMFDPENPFVGSDAQSPRNGVRWQKDFTVLENECYENFQRWYEIKALDKKSLMTYEIVEIEPADHMNRGDNQVSSPVLRRLKVNRDLAHWNTITEQGNVSNPKYDMIFMYAGIGQVKGPVFVPGSENGYTETEDYGQFSVTDTSNIYCRNPSGTDSHQQPYAYYDNMKRVNFDIWFEHSIHASLISAMTKADELVNIVGKQNVKIGKVVPLDKFIQIV